MVHRFHWTVGLLPLVFASSALGGERSTKTGKYFLVVCHFENDRIATAALKTAEMVWPVATELFGTADGAPDKPAEIHLFRSVEEYEKVDAELAGGAFRRNLAFSSWNTKAAYIVVQPDCSDATLKQVGLPQPTRRLIAHEATHLIRYATMENHRSHPHWIADGAATWVEEHVMAKGRWSRGEEDDPDASSKIVRTVALLEKGALPSVADILRDRIDDTPWLTRYSVRWLFLRFLEHSVEREKFRSILAKARQLGGGSGYNTQLIAFIEVTLGQEGMMSIDGRFAKYLRSLRPRWEEVYRSLETAGDHWTQIAFPDKNAIAWRTEPVGEDAYTLRGAFRVLPGKKQQLNLLLGRNDDGFVSIAFVAGHGVTIFHFHAKDDRWEGLGSVESDVLKLDQWIGFRVKVGGDRIRVVLDKKPGLEAPLSGRSMRGAWGLGAQNGSAGVWRGVRLK